MDIRATMIGSQPAPQPLGALSKPSAGDSEVRKAFDSFVGETFYGQMLKSLRSMNGKTPYFDGGQAEEIFRNQLDQTLAQDLTKSTAHEFTGPMFDLFQLQRG